MTRTNAHMQAQEPTPDEIEERLCHDAISQMSLDELEYELPFAFCEPDEATFAVASMGDDAGHAFLTGNDASDLSIAPSYPCRRKPYIGDTDLTLNEIMKNLNELTFELKVGEELSRLEIAQRYIRRYGPNRLRWAGMQFRQNVKREMELRQRYEPPHMVGGHFFVT